MVVSGPAIDMLVTICQRLLQCINCFVLLNCIKCSAADHHVQGIRLSLRELCRTILTMKQLNDQLESILRKSDWETRPEGQSQIPIIVPWPCASKHSSYDQKATKENDGNSICNTLERSRQNTRCLPAAGTCQGETLVKPNLVKVKKDDE